MREAGNRVELTSSLRIEFGYELSVFMASVDIVPTVQFVYIYTFVFVSVVAFVVVMFIQFGR